MPFLHWFKRTPANRRTEADIDQKVAKEPPPAPEPVSVDAPNKFSAGEAKSGKEPASESTPREEASASSEPTANATDKAPAIPNLSVAIGSFYAKLPSHLLVDKESDLGRSVQIAQEDVLIDEEAQQATVPLSILSLSCPDIFIRPVDSSDDIPITFSLRQQNIPKAERDKSASVPFPTSVMTPGLDTQVEASASGGAEPVKLRLQPILANIPPALGLPTIQSAAINEAEISLPLDTITSQLPNGRVSIPAQTFLNSLPVEISPLFAGINLESEIPIPLQEIFARLPADVTQTRKDQDLDRPDSPVVTPFSEHAAEDAQRFKEPSAETTLKVEKQKPPTNGTDAAAAGTRLQAIFLTDEPLDLAKTIDKIVELPGLQSCFLTTTEGLTLAGNARDPEHEKVISSVLADIFQRTHSRLQELNSGPLEGLTLYCGSKHFSTFVRDNLCLTVVHGERPFKPGVREKIQVILQELQALSSAEKPKLIQVSDANH
jgi:predicted regulator of Ras-like GTPase activity (Roadblock/LC7/MglB family)